jgi:YD repeat-containing protein
MSYNLSKTPLLLIRTKNSCYSKFLLGSAFLLLISQSVYSYNSQFYAVRGSNCGPNSWPSFSDAMYGCETVYKSRYSSFFKPGSGCDDFPHDVRQTSVTYFKDEGVVTGVRKGFALDLYCNGRFAGGAGIVANWCYIGSRWDSLQEKCVLGVEKEAGCPAAPIGDPCDAATGNSFQTEVDYSSGELKFVRYYNSLYRAHFGNYYHRENESNRILQTDINAFLDPQTTSSIGYSLGPNWSHNYSAYIVVDHVTGETVLVHRPNGKEVLLTLDVNGQWLSEADSTFVLTPNVDGGGWVLETGGDTTETYNLIGQLLSIRNRDGRETVLSYNSDALLSMVTGPFGRSIIIDYDDDGRIVTVSTNDGSAVISYQYDDLRKNLVKVIYSGAALDDGTDNPQKLYHYDDSRFPWSLTGITDENDNMFASWSFDGSGRVMSSEQADGVGKIELSYGSNSTTITDTIGSTTTYLFETLFRVRKIKSVTTEYNEGDQVISKSKYYSYAAENALLEKMIDYNGTVFSYEYNERGLLVEETKAKNTPEEYTIFTEWHPNFRLPTRRTEPSKITEYSYDDKGRLLNRVERPMP